MAQGMEKKCGSRLTQLMFKGTLLNMSQSYPMQLKKNKTNKTQKKKTNKKCSFVNSSCMGHILILLFPHFMKICIFNCTLLKCLIINPPRGHLYLKLDIILVKINVIRVVFQDQVMYVRTSFRGAKMCKIREKGVIGHICKFWKGQKN